MLLKRGSMSRAYYLILLVSYDWKGAPDEIRVDAYTITFPKIPHGRFLYVKQQARRFLVNANYGRKTNKQLSQH